MENDGPSRTALITAYARAHHQVVDRPQIFTDPLAVPLLGVSAAELADQQLGDVVSDRPRRLFFAARSRFAEDAVAEAAAAGVRQVVILGAGLDTFAYRNPFPTVRVFEVDHPATQAWKRERLAAAGIELPETLTFVPVDFETQTLAAGLASAGFQRSEAAVFVWLGVVFYLTPNAAHATLEYIAGQGASVEVVFDYLQPADSDDGRAHQQARADRLADIGEPVFSYFTSDDIATQLRDLGFTDIDDHSAPDLLTHYLDRSPTVEAEPPAALRAIRILRARR
ncbi:class I SAM-dependent methyltransferase [Nocardia sp. NPDC056064]|uniref:class I SAM-dependent methyltransferase n=1 Tax=Nocardia sp. NPDC056064 TaxID=3345701 RepID=UPI0035DF3972